MGASEERIDARSISCFLLRDQYCLQVPDIASYRVGFGDRNGTCTVRKFAFVFDLIICDSAL